MRIDWIQEFCVSWWEGYKASVEMNHLKAFEQLACRTGVIFCVILANRARGESEREARVACEGRNAWNTQKLRLFCRLSNNSTRARLGWTFSYICCIFVHPDLDSVPLVAGIQERSNNKRRESLVVKTVFVPYTLYEVDNLNNIMGDKWLLNFSVKFQRKYIISLMKLHNCYANVWCGIIRYNKQVKKPLIVSVICHPRH